MGSLTQGLAGSKQEERLILGETSGADVTEPDGPKHVRHSRGRSSEF